MALHSVERAPIALSISKFRERFLFDFSVTVPRHVFIVGGPHPQRRGRGLQLVGALGRDPRGARNGERTAAIPVAVAEKIAI